jgi:hypothetical protein
MQRQSGERTSCQCSLRFPRLQATACVSAMCDRLVLPPQLWRLRQAAMPSSRRAERCSADEPFPTSLCGLNLILYAALRY